VCFDILSYTIGNNTFCTFKNVELKLIIITARVYKLQLAEVNFLSWLNVKNIFLRKNFFYVLVLSLTYRLT